jgi:hypothetical protein
MNHWNEDLETLTLFTLITFAESVAGQMFCYINFKEWFERPHWIWTFLLNGVNWQRDLLSGDIFNVNMMSIRLKRYGPDCSHGIVPFLEFGHFFWCQRYIFKQQKIQKGKGPWTDTCFQFCIQNIHLYHSKQLQYLKTVIANDVLASFTMVQSELWFLFAFTEQKNEQWCYDNCFINDVVNNYLLSKLTVKEQSNEKSQWRDLSLTYPHLKYF